MHDHAVNDDLLLLAGVALIAWGWHMTTTRSFTSPPLPRDAIASARAARARQRAAAGLPPDNRPGSPFGHRQDPITGGAAHHAGQDFIVPTGTPVLAVDDGVVVETRASESGGLLVRYDTARGRVSCMHLSAIHVSVGERVVAGQVIAATGNTGRSTGPHLHLEYRPHGSPHAVDPWPMIAELV
jgi:murein DD-endopeptidase MepM/ murein hydrolase activator NlpD